MGRVTKIMAGFDSTKYPLCEKVCHLFQKVDIFILVVVIVIAIWRQKLMIYTNWEKVVV